MKIAVITDDGRTISRHFGRALYYLVFTIEDGKVTHQETREKPGHQQFISQNQDQHSHAHGEQHGFDPASQNRHFRMAEVIQDCQFLISGGMGMGAYEGMKSSNIQPIVTDLQDINEAVNAWLSGNLRDRQDLLH